MTDVVAFNIRIRSGRHDRFPIPAGEPRKHDPGGAIAYLALTPAADYEDGFASNIGSTAGTVQSFVAPGELVGLLRKLFTHSDDEVREEACLALSSHFTFFTDPCLRKLLSSTDPSIRQQAARSLESRSNPKAIVEMLKRNPYFLSVSGRVEDLADDIDLLTFDEDPNVRVHACEALRRLFPLHRFSRCDAEQEGKDGGEPRVK